MTKGEIVNKIRELLVSVTSGILNNSIKLPDAEGLIKIFEAFLKNPRDVLKTTEKPHAATWPPMSKTAVPIAAPPPVPKTDEGKNDSWQVMDIDMDQNGSPTAPPAKVDIRPREQVSSGVKGITASPSREPTQHGIGVGVIIDDPPPHRKNPPPHGK